MAYGATKIRGQDTFTAGEKCSGCGADQVCVHPVKPAPLPASRGRDGSGMVAEHRKMEPQRAFVTNRISR